ncbi:efflux RND transporter periplasmic adaptor subunit [Taklimakanibacter deserti]|uniref:efflux RND transporter periplasmic adaptor subunit n=1 Tax=Taklimakanibacter deserti TaxID=2267839 RepID=UPI000E656C81
MPSSLLQPFAALALLIVLAGCDAQTAPAPKAGRPVQVQAVSFNNEAMSRDFVGVVRARYESDLSFRVAGKMIARKVNVGDHVRAGDIIAELDSQDLQLEAQSAEAEFAAATSNLDQAAADLKRYTKLKERGFASNADYDRKKAANDEAEGRMERARRSLDLARNQLAYAELKADADGVITATLAEPGQVVAIGQGVARLARDGAKEALVALPETWLGEARNAQATVRLWTDRDKIFAAHLRELSPQADAATRTYAARFDIEDADSTVAFGMTTTVTLSRASDERAARLPLSAILNRGKGPSVFLVDASDTLELRPVTVASFTEDAAVVTSGISDGDKIVTLGVQKLEAGAKVRVVEAE